ncbi:alpha-2-macroglobulin family protein [Spirosoma sp. KUDC1026]|uniref:alpha-2-macroglobulin family protein n=1 Tax=Spirosoma sp. KUDC1026 TaxID=2745947 RepID=UPI00159BEA16|nr:alpha-2-macroglobulin family protein [Spirosoma sp. KUDC1026]QKZ11578.1 alpha-2-macroglobulin [Spirosoma sp. KUDC1026]
MQRFLIFLFTLIALGAHAQQTRKSVATYDPDWQRIDSLNMKGLPQSALAIVDQIYKRAKAERNERQLVKAVIYRQSLQKYSDAGSTFQTVQSLQQELAGSTLSTPARNILQSVLAETYWQYYQQNRWKFQNRTTIVREPAVRRPGQNQAPENQADSLATWNLHRLITEIIAAYKTSLQNEATLKETPIAAYDLLLDKGSDEGRLRRPTVYDFLAHRALDFFKNTEADLIRPAQQFELDQPAYLATPNRFATVPLRTSDSLSLRFQTLTLYQRLIVFHLSDRNPIALADVDADRLTFVHQHSIFPEKDSLYQQTLTQQLDRYKNQPPKFVYGLALAQYWEQQSYRDKTGNWRRQADSLLTSLLQSPPDEGQDARNARTLQTQLRQRQLQLTVEEGNAPQQPIRALVNYRNTPSFYYRIVRAKPAEVAQNSVDNRKNPLLKRWLSLPTVVERTVQLPDNGDLQDHSTEIALPALPVGHYVILSALSTPLTDSTSMLAYTPLVVTELSYLIDLHGSPAGRNAKPTPTIYAMHRQTGKPLPNVTVQLAESYYANNRQQTRPVGNYKTDAQGRFQIPQTVQSGKSYPLWLIDQQDTLETAGVYNARPNPSSDTDTVQTNALLFTDRAIYRPGQPIYFKGVLYAKKGDQLQVAAGRSTPVTLTDANGEGVSSLTLTANEFGTVEGKFTAPAGRLTGMMTISILDDQTSIRVEEYKRPTFEVVADPVKGSYKLGQSIAIKANAKTFSGAPIDGAQVRYRITRQLLPRWPWLKRGWQIFPPASSQETEIANGTLTTTNTGTLSLSFVASPDRSVDRKTNPIFQYTITFDVTDVSGETRSAKQTLRIGYSALTAALNIPEQIEGNRQAVGVSIQNAGGQPVPATGQLTVYPIQAPQPALRKRLWEQPDRFVLSRDEFKRLFPLDVYQDEDQPENWPRSQAIAQLPVRTSGRDSVSLDLSKYPAGAYVAELTVTDSTGETARQTQYFTVTTPQRPVLAVLADNWVRVVESEVKPGKTATIWLANDGPGWALMRTDTQEKWIKLGDKPVRIAVPIPASTRTNVSISFTKIQNGRLYQDTKTIPVSQADQRLTIETITFRERLKPGQPEEWTLRISGPGKEKVMAEAVATLYDASLDNFQKLHWPDVNRSAAEDYSFNGYWSDNGFKTRGSVLLNYDLRSYPFQTITYDALKRLPTSPVYRAGAARTLSGAVSLKGAATEVAPAIQTDRFGWDSQPLNEVVEVGYGQSKTISANEPQLNPRRNFNETAFFFPTLHTDKEGRILLKFTMPEALTRWRLMLFAHSKTMQTGSLERSVVTQKELMITTNAPRFLREGDTLRLTARVNNLTSRLLAGSAQLELFDAATNQPIDASLKHVVTPVNFTAQANQSTALGWTLVIPAGLDNVTVRVTAKAGAFTDGEERTLPVLPNRMLVLDAKPFYLNGTGTKTVTLDALKNQTNIASQAERLTIELTSNPVWTALQSLPYLDNQSLLCSEQLFSQFYANALGSRIVSARPDVQQVVANWQKQAPTNPLAANEELKAVTLNETPWRQAARTQTEQQAQLGQFLQTDNLLARQQLALDKLKQLQMPDGGLVWFAGMPTDPIVTLHVLSGFGHLAKLGVTFKASQQQQIQAIQNSALQFADTYANQWLERQQKEKVADGLSYWAIQYLYTRSFYSANAADSKAVAYIKTQAVKNWLQSGLQEQAMIALALHRLGDRKTPVDILKSLKERATTSDEMGMYWPANKAGFYWQQAPVETQALLIEAFDEITGDQTAVNNMKQWLLAQKRTQAWPSTKATTEAIYALLLKGDEWTATKPATELRVGGTLVTAAADEPTGYQKVTYQPAQIKSDMGTVSVTKTGSGPTFRDPTWGGIYYQHFEPLDRIVTSDRNGNLVVAKTLYRRQDSSAGPVITPVSEQTTLKPGDLVTVRVELRNDRDMQYVHLKDSRASGFEPVAMLSGYKFQNGLGYYEAPRDASTDFFLYRLPAGTHVFEYQVRVVHTGAFAAGIATVQSFYAPEFSAHSAGSRVSVK